MFDRVLNTSLVSNIWYMCETLFHMFLRYCSPNQTSLVPYVVQLIVIFRFLVAFADLILHYFFEQIKRDDIFLRFFGMLCITHFVVFHVFLRISQILLTFRRDQIMYNVFCVLPCVEVTWKENFSVYPMTKLNPTHR